MNKKWYKFSGWVVLIVGLLLLLSNLYLIISDIFYGRTIASDFFFSIFLLILTVVIFYFPGKYYLMMGSGRTKENGLIKASLIITLVGIAIMILSIPFSIIYCRGFDVNCNVLISALAIFFYSTTPYGIAVLLLIINWIRKLVISSPS